MLLIYTVMLVAVIEEENIYVKIKDPLSFEIWIFSSGQPDCDHNNKFCRDDFNQGAA